MGCRASHPATTMEMDKLRRKNGSDSMTATGYTSLSFEVYYEVSSAIIKAHLRTVLGAVQREDLGLTLTHEHLSLNFDKFYREPPDFYKDFFRQDLSLATLGALRQYPYSSKDNIKYMGADVEAAVLEDCKLFKRAGGGTIVENTSWGIERNLDFMVQVSKETGVNVIAGTGHYVEEVQKAETLSWTVEAMADLYRRELTQGCADRPGIRCGFIGEVGSSWPITGFERRCITATGVVQSELGCPVSFHPGRHHEAPEEILRLYSEAGGDLSKAVMSHLDRTFGSAEETVEFSDLGSYCQFDLFGTEVSYYQLWPARDMLSDGGRIARISALLEAGKGDKILASHDIHTRHRLVKYGGHGFAHIPIQVRQHMTARGLPATALRAIFVTNPATWLTA